MNARMQDLRLAATLLMQARVLCAGALDFCGDNAEHAIRLNKIGATLEEECAHIERLLSSMKRAHGETENGSAKELEDRAPKPSRIEQLNAELVECERLSHQLDELTNTFDSGIP